jgi:predicted DNA-binding protein
MPDDNKRLTTLRLDVEFIRRLKVQAAKRKTTMSKLVTEAVEAYLRRKAA